MERAEAVPIARRLVQERFPDAIQAWLSGSVVLGGATSTSDLDITVVRVAGEVFRESLTYAGWAAEIFVHTPDSIRWFVAQDLERRQPSMARLVATGVPLLPGEAGDQLRAECRAALDAGPRPLTREELESRRYGLTDLLDDLADAEPGPVGTAIAVAVWHETAELALATAGAWSGTGKWLMRELQAVDEQSGVDLPAALDRALRSALDGEPGPLTALADQTLDQVGGRLWAGFHQSAPAAVLGAGPG